MSNLAYLPPANSGCRQPQRSNRCQQWGHDVEDANMYYTVSSWLFSWFSIHVRRFWKWANVLGQSWKSSTSCPRACTSSFSLPRGARAAQTRWNWVRQSISGIHVDHAIERRVPRCARERCKMPASCKQIPQPKHEHLKWTTLQRSVDETATVTSFSGKLATGQGTGISVSLRLSAGCSAHHQTIHT